MNIVIIGSGNIATHLAKTLYATNNKILQVYSRTLANAQALANLVFSDTINELTQINTEADLYIIAVSDSAITAITAEIPKSLKGIVVHTSGSIDLAILNDFKNSGVIYPPQSINKEIETDLSLIPFGIEGNTRQNFEKLFSLIQAIAPKTFACSSQQRLTLHMSAVIVNNFSNALFLMAKEIMEKENLNFDLLKPIILETALKVQNHTPLHTQTGPARRGDYNIIDRHLQFLSQYPVESKIYQVLTDFIIKRYNN
jgi:predicted short-subunit dehydrogenase-like oxidoreductase (DUF2520 family)